jgi:regulator of protease activity HflC (stomatin/prohibitin superfamily)
VQSGKTGVVLTFGEASLVSAEPGLHFKIPFVQRVIKMDTQTQKYSADASAASKDLQVVSTTVAVNYHLLSSSAPVVFSSIGKEYEDRILAPAIQEAVKSVTAKYTAEELITKRESVKEEMATMLQDRINPRGIIIETISITNFDFSTEFNNIIEQKVVAEQQKLKAENDLRTIEVIADQRRTQAQAEADANLALKRAEADGLLLLAKAEAESIQLKQKALQDSPEVVALTYAQRWDGHLPKFVMNGQTPMMLDVSTAVGQAD